MSAQYELYRRCSLGLSLTDTLDELIQDGHIDPQMAMKILLQYDHSMAEFLHSKVKSRATIRGHLHIYRFCDDVWTFVIDKPEFKMDDNDVIVADKAKVVACAAKPTNTNNA